MTTTLYGWLIVLAAARPQQANDIKKDFRFLESP